MDVLQVLSHGCAALTAAAAAALLWRRGTLKLPLPAWQGDGEPARPRTDGFLASLMCQSSVPASLLALGMGIRGRRGAGRYALGAGAALFLVPLLSLLPLLPACLLGLAGLMLLFPGRSDLCKSIGCMLLSVSAIGIFSHFASLAASDAVLSVYRPGSGFLLLLLLFLMGICMSYLFSGEGFALMLPVSALSSGLIPVHAYLFYAGGVSIGSFLCVLVAVWDLRPETEKALARLCLHRVLTALMAVVSVFLVPVLFPGGRVVPVLLWAALLPALASLPLLPLVPADVSTEGSADRGAPLYHPLYDHLPCAAERALRRDGARLFAADRDLFALAAGTSEETENADGAALQEQDALARSLEDSLKNALAARGEGPGALWNAVICLGAMREAIERLIPEDGTFAAPLPPALEERTLREIDGAMAVFTDTTSRARLPQREDEDTRAVSSARNVQREEICAGISRCARMAASGFEGREQIPG